ncbi:hypothetical protein KEM48_010409 [Puccinia striiformis f. sp. tritici PST-130]|nr:hypothetical protein KEM48_010409 [Puccinia striiformis f. sp. tritici PST-130]
MNGSLCKNAAGCPPAQAPAGPETKQNGTRLADDLIRSRHDTIDANAYDGRKRIPERIVGVWKTNHVITWRNSTNGVRRPFWPLTLSSRISLSTLNLPQPHPNIVNILDIDRSNPHSSSISSSSLIDIARHPIPIIFLVISSSEGPASCSFQFDHYLFRVSGFRLIAISVVFYHHYSVINKGRDDPKSSQS